MGRARKGHGKIEWHGSGYTFRFTDPIQHKQVWFNQRFATKEEAEKAQLQNNLKIAENRYSIQRKDSVSEYADMWLEQIKQTKSRSTWCSYDCDMRKHILPALGSIKVTMLNRRMCQRFVTDLNGKDLSASTKRHILTVLNAMLNDAVDMDIITENPAHALGKKLTKEQASNPLVLEESDIPAFIDALKDEPLKNLVLIALYTGLREGEVVGLTWKNVNLKTGRIDITQQQGRKYKGVKSELKRLKTDSSVRYFIAPPLVLDILNEEKRKQNRNGIHSINGYVFMQPDGKAYTHATASKIAKCAFKKIGKEELTYRKLRTTFSTVMLNAGASEITINAVTGHATKGVTDKYYISKNDDMLVPFSRLVQSTFKRIIDPTESAQKG